MSMDAETAGGPSEATGVSLKRHLLVGGANVVAARVSMMAFGFMAYLYLTRTLGPADYGLYGLAVSISQWVAILVQALAGGATVQLVAGNRDGDRFAVSILRLAMVLGLILAAALAVSAPWLSEVLRASDLSLPLSVMALEIPLMGMSAVHGHVLMARGRFRESAYLAMGYWAFRLFLSVSLVHHGGTAVWATVALPIASLLQLGVASRLTGISVMDRDSVPWRSLLLHNRKRTASVLLNGLFSRMDMVAVQWWGGSSYVTGLYAAARNLSDVTGGILNSGQAVVLPVLAKAHGRGDKALRDGLGREFLRYSLYLGGWILAISVLCLDGLTILLGSEYDGAGLIAMILLMGVGVRFIGSAGSVILNVRGERGAILPQMSIVIAFALACYRWLPDLLPAFPFTVVIALVAFCAGLAMSFFHLRELALTTETAIPWLSYWRTTAAFVVSVSLALFARFEWIPVRSWIGLFLLGGIVSATFLIVLWALGERYSATKR
jgi:O-antigen/teichoic acid export membrane protein